MGKTLIVLSVIVAVTQAWELQDAGRYTTKQRTVRRNYHPRGPVNGAIQRADTERQTFFKAAVYEHAVVLPLLPFYSRQMALKAMWKNLDIYEDQVVKASSQVNNGNWLAIKIIIIASLLISML